MKLLKHYIEHETKVKYVEGILNKSQEWNWFIDYIKENFEFDYKITSYEDFRNHFNDIKAVFTCLIKINGICDLKITSNDNLSVLNNISKYYLSKIDYEDVKTNDDFYTLLLLTVLLAKIKNQTTDTETKYLIYTDFFELHNVFKIVDIISFTVEESKYNELFDKIQIDISKPCNIFWNNINQIEKTCSDFAKRHEDFLHNCDCISYGKTIQRTEHFTWEEYMLSEISSICYRNDELQPYASFDGISTPNFNEWSEKNLDVISSFFNDTNVTAIVESIKYALHKVTPSYTTIEWHIDLLYDNYHLDNIEKLYCSSLEFVISFFNDPSTSNLFDSNLKRKLSMLFEEITDVDFLLYVTNRNIVINKNIAKRINEYIKAEAEKVESIDSAGNFISFIENEKICQIADKNLFAALSDKFDEIIEKQCGVIVATMFYSYQVFLIKIKNNKGIISSDISSEIVYIRSLWQDIYYKKCVSGLQSFEHSGKIPSDEVDAYNSFLLEHPYVFALSQMKLKEEAIVQNLISASEHALLLMVDRTTIKEDFPHKRNVYIDDKHPVDKLYNEKLVSVLEENGYKLLNVLKPQDYIDNIYDTIRNEMEIGMAFFHKTEDVYNAVIKNNNKFLPYSQTPTIGDLTQLFPLLEKRIRDIGATYAIAPICESVDKMHRLKEPSSILTTLIKFIYDETNELVHAADFFFIHFCMYGENGLNIRNDCIHGNGFESPEQINFAYKVTLICLYLIEYRYKLISENQNTEE